MAAVPGGARKRARAVGDAVQTLHALPFVSVIVPTYNGAGTLDAQLAALYAQRYAGPWEVIVVDNRSTDATVQIVGKWLDRMPNLRLVPAYERQGRGYALNCGARAARGEIFLFCDCDDVAGEGWVSAMAEALCAHSVVVGLTEIERLNQRRPGAIRPYNSASHVSLDFLPHATGCNSGVTREAFEAVGGFEEHSRRAQDIDFSWRLQLAGYQIFDAPDAVLHYRYREGLRSVWRQTVHNAIAHAWLYRRFRSRGMPRSSWRAALRDYLWLVRYARILPVRPYEFRVAWVYRAGLRWGRFLGSLIYRVWYP